MSLAWRPALALLLVFASFLLAAHFVRAADSIAAPPDRPGLLVTVGEISHDRAMLWIRGDSVVPARVSYGVSSDDRDVRRAEIALEPDRDNTGRVSLGPLVPGARYRYEVAHDGAVARGTFVSAPAPESDARARILWSGDLGGREHCRTVEHGYPIFRAMTRHRPDLFLFVGDTVYADQRCGLRPHVPGADYVAATLAQFHGKHRYNRADPALQEFFRSTAVFPIWDDHEVRNNFAGPGEPLMPVALQALLDYWPIVGPPHEPRRLYRHVRWGRHLDVFILDTRQYRSPHAERDGPGKSMLGPSQRQWLLHGLAASDATWKLVVSTVPLGMFTGGDHSDSWSSANLFGFLRATATGYVHERETILGFLHDARIRNVVFLSGEVHHAELIRHEPRPGFAVHEFVAGPLSARQGYPRFLDRSLRSRSLGSLGFSLNFGELLVDGRALEARIFDDNDVVRASVRLPAEGAPTETVRDQRRQAERAGR
jgi:alkaline phosphatase D